MKLKNNRGQAIMEFLVTFPLVGIILGISLILLAWCFEQTTIKYLSLETFLCMERGQSTQSCYRSFKKKTAQLLPWSKAITRFELKNNSYEASIQWRLPIPSLISQKGFKIERYYTLKKRHIYKSHPGGL